MRAGAGRGVKAAFQGPMATIRFRDEEAAGPMLADAPGFWTSHFALRTSAAAA